MRQTLAEYWKKVQSRKSRKKSKKSKQGEPKFYCLIRKYFCMNACNTTSIFWMGYNYGTSVQQGARKYSIIAEQNSFRRWTHVRARDYKVYPKLLSRDCSLSNGWRKELQTYPLSKCSYHQLITYYNCFIFNLVLTLI